MTPSMRPAMLSDSSVMLSKVSLGSHLGCVMFLTQTGRVTVEVSLKVAATKSSVTRQLKKICDTCV